MIDFILHIDQHLIALTAQYGIWIYAILFLIVFCETGLVVTPFLPGDSLLFSAGAVAAASAGTLNMHLIVAVLLAAAILGDASNFEIGKHFGEKLFARPDSKIFKPEYLAKTHAFYEKYGGKTIILARFVPIVRTFAPFVAAWGICITAASCATTSSARWLGWCRSPIWAMRLAMCRLLKTTLVHW